MKSLKNKIAFVTGGTSGIGKSTAMAFADAGAKVCIAARSADKGNEIVEQIQRDGGQAIFIQTDVSDSMMVKAAIEKTTQKLGGLDFCFNNAGATLKPGVPFHEFSEKSWKQLIDVNLSGIFYCMKYQIAYMLKNGGGVIVNMSSVAGLISKPFVGAGYNAAKHGVIGLTKNAALYYAKSGIRVNAVCPGVIETPLVESLPDEIKKAAVHMHPTGRFGEPHEVANTVLWLCSEKSAFITGQSIAIDGGLTIG